METQEQKMVEQLSMRRMEIEMLRCEVLFRYYERLLGLDVINDRDEVKSIMTCINTLERYARKYEKKFEELFANQKEAMPEVAVSESDSPKEANRVADIDMDREECELPDIEDREQSQVPLVATCFSFAKQSGAFRPFDDKSCFASGGRSHCQAEKTIF